MESSMANQSLHTSPIKSETNMHTFFESRCGTSSDLILPPIRFLHNLLHAPVPPAFSEHMAGFSGWTMPLKDMQHSVIASKHSSDHPSSRPYPPTQAGAPQHTSTLDKKSSWRRTPKRWGLAEWERDDSGARERRREQNREAQRRFREKRHRAADSPSPRV